MLGSSVPSWLLSPGPVLLGKLVRNKNDESCDEVELVEANSTYARVRFPSRRESNAGVTNTWLAGHIWPAKVCRVASATFKRYQ